MTKPKGTKPAAAPKATGTRGPRRDGTRVANAMRIAHATLLADVPELLDLIDDQARADTISASIREELARHTSAMDKLRAQREFAGEFGPLDAHYQAMIRSAVAARLPEGRLPDEPQKCEACGRTTNDVRYVPSSECDLCAECATPDHAEPLPEPAVTPTPAFPEADAAAAPDAGGAS